MCAAHDSGLFACPHAGATDLNGHASSRRNFGARVKVDMFLRSRAWFSCWRVAGPC